MCCAASLQLHLLPTLILVTSWVQGINTLHAFSVMSSSRDLHKSWSACDVVKLRFDRQSSSINSDEAAVIKVNASVTYDVMLDIQLHASTNNSRVVDIETEYFPLRVNTTKSIEIRIAGHDLGVAALHFYITRHTHHNSTQHKLCQHYEVTVLNRHATHALYLRGFLLAVYALNLVVVGGQIDGHVMLYMLRKPLLVSLSLLCRYGLTPALSLGVIEILRPRTGWSLGLLAMTCTPTEGVSSMLISLAEGDVSLGVTVLVVNNFSSIAMLPLWMILFEKRLSRDPGGANIPFYLLFTVFFYLVIAYIIGALIQRRLPGLYSRLFLYTPPYTILALFITLIVEIYLCGAVYRHMTFTLLMTSFALSTVAYVTSAGVALLARRHPQEVIAFSLATASKTSWLSSVLIERTFTRPQSDINALGPSICFISSLLPITCLVLCTRVYQRYQGAKINFMNKFDDPDEELSVCLPNQEVVQDRETAI